ncbi:MAG: transcriptional regulator [Candidatus Thorarchaeota archaeon]
MSQSEKKQEKQVKRRTWMMPQEVEVWYVLPAIRREFARVMKTKEVPRIGEDGKTKQHRITQKEIAKMLGVTEPAITQYLLKKKGMRSRGDQVAIPERFLHEIEMSADRIIAGFEKRLKGEDMFEIMTREVNRILKIIRDDGAMCDIHQQFSAHVKGKCSACDM